MTVGIVVIVDRLIANAQRMLDDGTYDWPASRAGLERILADLEARSLGHPNLEGCAGSSPSTMKHGKPASRKDAGRKRKK